MTRALVRCSTASGNVDCRIAIVARPNTSKMPAFGHDWNFAGRSADICKLDWRSP